MSTQCFSTYTDGANGSVYRCKLPSGHDAWHQNGDWEWWDEGGKLEAEKVIGRPDSPQQTMTSLQRIESKLDKILKYFEGTSVAQQLSDIDALVAVLLTEFRGLREDQQRMNGLLLERLTNIDRKFSGVYGGQDALATAFNRNTGDLGESAMRNHTQVMDALNRYFAELKHLYGKLNYNLEQRRAKRRK